MGCIVYEGEIADDLEAGIIGQGFRIEVYNTLGAGDSFMAGFLRGWLRGEPHAISATYELFAWLMAVLSGSAAMAFLGTQGDVWDTQWDMLIALVGALTAQLLLTRLHERQLGEMQSEGPL